MAADPTELEQVLQKLIPDAASTESRVLGAASTFKGPLPTPGPIGPTRAPVATRFLQFQAPRIPPQPPMTEPIAPESPPINANLAGLTDEVNKTYQNQVDPGEQDRMYQWMSMAQQQPMPPDPIQWPNYAQSMAEKLSGMRDLAGAPHDQMVALTGMDHSSFFADPGMNPELLGVNFDEARWARGVLEEASKASLDLNAELPMLPQAEAPVRIAALAQRVMAVNPNAPVGPPDNLMKKAPELRSGMIPVQPPSPQTLPILDTAQIRANVRSVAPAPEEFEANPEGVAIRHQQIFDTLGSSQPFHAGELEPSYNHQDPRFRDAAIPSSVSVHVDEGGRLMAEVSDSKGNTYPVEITGGIGPAALPASVGGAPVKWTFTPSPVAPVALRLDEGTEQLVVDPEETTARRGLQDAWAQSQHDAHREGDLNPLEDPITFLKHVGDVRLPTSAEADNLVQNADNLVAQQARRTSTVLEIPPVLAGPDTSPRQLAIETDRVIRENFAIASVTELCRVIAGVRQEDVLMTQALDQGDLFGFALGNKKTEDFLDKITPEVKADLYSAKPNPSFAGRWSTLRHLRGLSNVAAAQILAHPEPLDWKDPDNHEEVIDRIVNLAIPEIQAQLKSSNSGVEWYRKDIKRTLSNARRLYPDITKDEMVLFLQMLAITSNGHTPAVNFALAAYAMDQYYATGAVPVRGPHSDGSVEDSGSGWGGIKSQTISHHMNRLQGLLDIADGDVRGLRKFLLAEIPIGSRSDPEEGSLRHVEMELRGMGKWTTPLTTESDDSTIALGEADEVVRGAMLFGPKLGAYFCNMNGISNYLTIDAWKNRTFNRWMGDVPTKTDQKGQLVLDDTVGQMKRKLLQEAYEEIVTRLQPKLGQRFDVMDAQATLWYYEKRLFAQAGAKPTATESYSEASTRYLTAFAQRQFPDNFFLGGAVGESLRAREGLYDYRGRGPDPDSRERRPVDPEAIGSPELPERRKPNMELKRMARDYMTKHTLVTDEKPFIVRAADKRLKEKCAHLHEVMPHIPFAPEVQLAYQHLKTEALAQFLYATALGYHLEPWPFEAQPYANSAEMMADLRKNRHLYIYQGGELEPGHPLAEESPVPELNYNEILRGVHDLFGHAMAGNQFGDSGEAMAYMEHSRMFTHNALPALAAETFLQSSWVNFGPYSDQPVAERPYAPQKAYIVPPTLLEEIRQTYMNTMPMGHLTPDALPRSLEDISITIFDLSNEGSTLYSLLQDAPFSPPNGGYEVAADASERRYTAIPFSAYSSADILQAVLRNSDILGHPDVLLSVWRDPQGLVWIEPTQVVMNPFLANDLGQRRGQTMIWNWDLGEAEMTGGTGLAGDFGALGTKNPDQIERTYLALRAMNNMGTVEVQEPRGNIIGQLFSPRSIKFLQDGPVDITGARVNSPHDVAAIMNLDRNPVFETSHFIFVDMDEGKVLNQIALTYGSPFFAPAYTQSPGTRVKGEDLLALPTKERGDAYGKATLDDVKKFQTEVSAILAKFKQDTGHTIKLVMTHNHPAGMSTPSPADVNVTRALKARFGNDFLYGVVTDHDTFHLIDGTGEVSQHNIPEDQGEDILKGTALMEHPLINENILDLDKVIEGLPTDPQSKASVLYCSTEGHIRLVEQIDTEMLDDWHKTKDWTSRNAKTVGAPIIYIYHPDPVAAQIPLQEMQKLFMAGACNDFVWAGGKSILSIMSPEQINLGDNARQFYRGVAPDTRLATDSIDDTEKARLRTAALARAAAGEGWSGREGAEQFSVLTDDERFQAMLARISAGKIANERHLESLNPRTWTSKSFPKYFGSWRPQPHEMATLQRAHDERAETWRTAKTVETKLATNAGRREKAPNGGAKGITPLTLDDLLTIQPSTLDQWAKDSPGKYDEWVRQFYKVVDPMTEEAAKLPDASKRQESMAHLDILRDMLASLEESKVWQGPHPNGEPGGPYNGIQVALLNARNSIKALTTLTRMMSRPSTVLGNTRQGDHPLDILEDVQNGKLGRSLFHTLWEGDMARHQATTDTFHQFDLLQRAAAASEETDRKIRTILDHNIWKSPQELDRPEWQVPPVRMGARKVPVNLKEWMPKLGKWYEDTIAKAEKSIIYRLNAEAGGYHSDLLWLEQEMRRREVLAAKAGGWTGKSWQDIPPKLLTGLQAKLAKENSVTDNQDISMVGGLPNFLGLEPYRRLKARHATAKHQYEKRRDGIKSIKDGSLRREGYVTYVHRMTVDFVRQQLSDPYSTFGRYTNPKVKNHYLDARLSDKEPYTSWLTGWMMYVPAMMRTTHLEPALLRASKRIETLPTSQQQYGLDWIRHLKGIDVPWDKLMNRVAFEDTILQPNAIDGIIKGITGADIPAMVRGARDAGQLNPRPYSSALRFLGGWAFFGLVGPVKITKLHLTTFAFLGYELSKRPLPDMPLGVPWGAMGLMRGGKEGLMELASWLSHSIVGTPRYLGEATHMAVTSTANDLIRDAMEIRSGQKMDPLNMGLSRSARTWGAMMKCGEYWLRASTYYTLKNRARWYGHDEKMCQEIAAQQTNHLIGAYSKRDLSPVARGAFWNPWWLFKRFSWAKVEQFAMTAQGASEAVGHAMNGLTGSSRFGRPEPGDGAGGGGLIPPEPPDLPGSPFEDWDDDERNTWREVNAPAAEFGSAFPAGVRGSQRLLMQLLLGATALGAGLYAMSILTGLNDETDDIWSEMNPAKLENLGEIPMLFWLKDCARLAFKLWPKGLIWGLTAKEVKEKEFHEQRLLYFIPMIGKALKDRHFRQAEEEQFLRRFMHEMGMPSFGNAPKGPSMGPAGMFADRHAPQPIVQPGLLYKLMNSVKGRPSMPQTPEPVQEPTQ